MPRLALAILPLFYISGFLHKLGQNSRAWQSARDDG
jgi:hypothetical protein